MTLALYTDPEGADLTGPTQLLERAGFTVEVRELRSEDELVAAVARAQPAALLVTYLPIGERTFAAAPSIRMVACGSVGFDCVDVEAATRAGVWVSNVPDAATEEVATHALAMALAVVRHLPFLDRHVRDGGWSYEAAGLPRRLSEMTLAVIGMGRIGRRLAEMGRGLFAEVAGYDPLIGDGGWPDGVRRAPLAECLAEADVVSLHVPLTADTDRLIDADALATMRPGSYLVNVSRGGLIDTPALLEALDSGRLAGAALDVTDPEPPAADDPVRRHPRVLVTPHAAFYSARALEAYMIRQAQNVVAWRRDGRPITAVNDLSVGVS